MQRLHRSSWELRSRRVRGGIALLVIVEMVLSSSPVQAEMLVEETRKAIEYTLKLIPTSRKAGGQDPGSAVQTPTQRAERVTNLSVCPRRLLLYVGETYTLAPLPLDRSGGSSGGPGKTVHGAAMSWGTKNAAIATVTSWGEVEALGPGLTIVTVQSGRARAEVLVEVREGARPKEPDQDYDLEHKDDCSKPESSRLIQPRQDLARRESAQPRPALYERADDAEARPAAFAERPSPAAARSAAAHSIMANRAGKRVPDPPYYLLGDPIDGDSGDTFAAEATQFYNAIGNSRFTPQDRAEGTTKTKRDLGSQNFVFSAPILSEGGRGVAIDLAMVYNSRTWNKDGSKMTFNYNKGWPAAGWALGYGRIIQNYDDSATGDGSGVGLGNKPGNYLLLQGDGTRVHLAQSYDSGQGRWKHDSTDGTFIHLNTVNGKLKYNDGTLVTYSMVNNRLLPVSVKSGNGDLVTIVYKDRTSSFKFRWAIDYITDTLGRVIRFYYDATTGFLTSITAPDFGGGERTMVKIDYQTITLKYDFGSMTIEAPASDTTLSVVKRLYYPQTGRGFLFLDYSTYGMARRISVRKDMTGSGGIVTDGTETAYTSYNYTTIDPSDPYGRNQVGHLNDSPQYTKRSEWWTGKTDANGNPDSQPTDYVMSRTVDSTEIDKTEYPYDLDVVTTTDNQQFSADFGRVLSIEYKKRSTGAVLRKTAYTYVAPPDGGVQIATVESFDENNAPTKIEYSYTDFGRVRNFYEYGYKQNGSYVVRRRTRYDYSDDAGHLAANMVNLVKTVQVYDALMDLDSGNDVLKAKTSFTYDDYTVKGGLEYYGLSSGSYPPNHDSAFDQNNGTRGNATGTQTWSSITPDVSTTLYTKYDIFGNPVDVDVSCCSVKALGFGVATYYSQPDWIRDGVSSGPNLTTSFLYNFNTGLLTQTTTPDGLATVVAYDNAWRLQTVNSPTSFEFPTGSVTTTKFDKDGNQNDQLAYSQQVSYSENGVPRVIQTKSWFNGAGQIIRSGGGAGTSPSNYDTVATVYDSIGRGVKRSNPYVGDSSGNGSPQYWTQTGYDEISRIKTVTLQDNQTMQTSYAGATSTNGATVTVTDQVGRQRKSETDGLGRLTSVVEQNPATGQLDPANYLTSYSYDLLDNLTQVSQGGQLRQFEYDALSRMTKQITPEGGTLSFTFTDFGAVLKRTDLRNVTTQIETHYKYDALHRLVQVWYTGLGGDDAGTIRPALPSEVAATADVTMSYRTSSPARGQIETIVDSLGSETYAYDSLARLKSRTRVLDGHSYQTQYEYSTNDQLSVLIYPSLKRVRMNHDNLGRMNGIDKVDSGGSVLSSYLTSIAYNTAGQVSGLNLGNGASETYGYSADRLQLTSKTVTKGSTLMNLTYGYQGTAGTGGTGTTAGNTGQLVSITGSINGQSRNQAFTYDNVGRLSTASGWSSWGRRYAYDRWGNRTGMWDAVSGGNQLQSITIAGATPNNRIATVNSVAYTYDPSGNLTNDGLHSYKYDAENRQVSVDGGVTATYGYDAANRRVKKVAGAATTYYVWEGDQVIAEYSVGNPPVVGGLRYLHGDRLSTRMLTDGAGVVKGTQDHLPFGEDAGPAGESERHRFTTYERDAETNSDYAMNRQHQQSNGRFMQPDPIPGRIKEPQTMNRYSYVSGDPINAVDPLGLLAIICWTVVSDPESGRIGVTETTYCAVINDGPTTGPPLRTGDPFIGGFSGQDLPKNDKACFDKVASTFGGPGSAGGDHGTLPERSNGNPVGAGKAHVYPSPSGTGKTNIYVPAGYDSATNVGGDNSTTSFYYGKNALANGLKDVTLLVQHVVTVPDLNAAKDRPENGRVLIGTTGGLDGGQVNGPNYQHAHIEVFRGPLPPLVPGAGESQQTFRNKARIPYRDVFCK